MLAYYLVTALHVLVCFILILVVLLQSGKGADLAGAFGGAGTQTAFGSRGPASFLSKLTTAAAIIFMITCLSLSMMSTKREVKSILDSTKSTSAPAAAPKAPVPAKALTQAPSPEQIRQIQKEIEKRQQEQKAAPAQVAPPPSTTQPAGQAQSPKAKPPSPESKPPAAGKKN